MNRVKGGEGGNGWLGEDLNRVTILRENKRLCRLVQIRIIEKKK